MRDFFISFNTADRRWAEWIAWVLEEAGYTVVFQPWDFRPGQDFILNMHKAMAETRRTIAVLSENYLGSRYTPSEWSAALARELKGEPRTLIPIRVGECQPEGLLQNRTY